MPDLTQILTVYLITINVATLTVSTLLHLGNAQASLAFHSTFATPFVYGIDKWKAKQSKWRVSETALLLAVLGGSLGAWLGMKVWHHKTLHKKFSYGIPLIIIAQIAVVIWVLSNN